MEGLTRQASEADREVKELARQLGHVPASEKAPWLQASIEGHGPGRLRHHDVHRAALRRDLPGLNARHVSDGTVPTYRCTAPSRSGCTVTCQSRLRHHGGEGLDGGSW